MTKKNLQLTEGEWAIIEAVWDNEPCAAPAVQELIKKQTGWTYSTVKTMMDRMVTKGLLTSKKIRNLFLYSSAVTKSQAQKREIMSTIRRAFGGAMTPMMQFLLENTKLSKKQLDELQAMIKKKRARK